MTPVSLAIFFAVPHEAALLKKKLKIRWQKKGNGLFVTQAFFKQNPILVGCLGMGERAVKKNLSFLLEFYSFPEAIMAGYAGALDPALNRAEVIFFSEHLVLPILKQGKMISVNEMVATVEEKQKLFRQTGVSICDMEFETVKSVCSQHKIVVHSLRAVSDTAQESLPVKALAKAYDFRKQRSTPFKLFLYLLRRPSEVLPFLNFVKNLSQPQDALTQGLWRFLENKFTPL